MIIGALTIDLAVYEALSLKDKRRVITSLIQRVKNRFNVSVAEVDNLDNRRKATIGIVMVSNDARYVHSCLDRIVDYVRTTGGATLLDYKKETL